MTLDARIKHIIEATRGKGEAPERAVPHAPVLMTDDLPLHPCECPRCFALRQDMNKCQMAYIQGPDFARLPPCPRSPEAVAIARLLDVQLAVVALSARIERLEQSSVHSDEA